MKKTKESRHLRQESRTTNLLHSSCNTLPHYTTSRTALSWQSDPCIMPRDRIIDCRHNSSSRSVAARISPV